MELGKSGQMKSNEISDEKQNKIPAGLLEVKLPEIPKITVEDNCL